MAERIEASSGESILTVAKRLVAEMRKRGRPTYAIFNDIVLCCDVGGTAMDLVAEYCDRHERRRRILHEDSTELMSGYDRTLGSIDRLFDRMFGGQVEGQA